MKNIQLDKDNIEAIARNFKDGKGVCNSFIEDFHGVIEKQYISDNWEKYILKNVSDSIKTVVLDCVNNNLKTIAFYGTLQISFNDLLSIYVKYRRVYASYDEITQFFFNEDKSKGAYVITCNIEGVASLDSDSWKEQLLSNVFISFLHLA